MVRRSMRYLLLASLLLTACDGWPLYANLPPAQPPVSEGATLEFQENFSLGPEDVQALGERDAPAVLRVSGAAASCGWDPSGEGPQWPGRPFDEDGDGQPDGEAPRVSGWFAADVDLFGFSTIGGGWVTLSLFWTRAPTSGVNAPYEPDDPGGAWASETDLDLVLLDWSDAEPGPVLSEAGFTRDHPEEIAHRVEIAPGGSLVAAVGCHHGGASEYQLEIVLGDWVEP